MDKYNDLFWMHVLSPGIYYTNKAPVTQSFRLAFEDLL